MRSSQMTATAGMFIYIAGSDLIPQVHHHRTAPGTLSSVRLSARTRRAAIRTERL